MLKKIKKYYLLNAFPLINSISAISLIIALICIIFNKDDIVFATKCIGVFFLIVCTIPFIDLFFNITENHYKKIDIETFEDLNSDNRNFLDCFFYSKNIDFLIKNYVYFTNKSNVVVFYYLREIERKSFYSDLLKLKQIMNKEHLIRVLLNFEKDKFEIFKNNDFIEILKEVDKSFLYTKYEEIIKYIIKYKITNCYDNIIELFEDFDNDNISIVKYNKTKIIEKNIIQKEIKIIKI